MGPAHLTCLVALLAAACASDLAERRIPNLVVALIVVTGLLAQFVVGGWRGVVGSALSAAAILVVFSLAWVFGKIGAGDLKLLASVAVWVGPSRMVQLVLYTAVAGLPVALGTRFIHRLGLWRFARTSTSAETVTLEPETVPVALAIAAGTAAVLTWG